MSKGSKNGSLALTVTDTVEQLSGDRINSSQIMEIMSNPDSVILIGLKTSDILACVHIGKIGKSSHIGMLAVSPHLQRAGTGKQMLTLAESYGSVNFGHN